MASNNPISREEELEKDGETIGGPTPSKLPAGLYLVATPIGNLGDISRRAIATLSNVDRIAAEDTRTTRKLLTILGVKPRRLERYDDHADEAARERLVAAIVGGEAVALVSDAGMPLIADPGYKLVRAVRAAGLRVTAIPGASAPLMALALSGLPTDRFYFGGFLPAKAAARRSFVAALAAIDATLVLFEAPQRLAESLADLVAGLGAERPAVIARELTKLFEELRGGTLAELAGHYAAAAQPKGEIVVVIGGPLDQANAALDDAAIDRRLREAMATMSLRDAVAAVAGATGQPKRAVYARALALGEAPRR